MRTITDFKFRAWCETDDGEEMIEYGSGEFDNGLWFDAPKHIDSHIAVMQWTGLTDKKGKEIYEGDIVEIIHPCWSATCETKFMDGAFWFIEKDNPVNNSQVRADKFLKQKWEIKVLGNIFETPELIN